MTLIFLVATLAVALAGTLLFLIILINKIIKNWKLNNAFAGSIESTVLEIKIEGKKKYGLKKGIRNIVIYWDRPFTALAGVNIYIPIIGNCFVPCGVIHSYKKDNSIYIAVTSVYIRKKATIFQFLLNREIDANKMAPYCLTGEEEQLLNPS